jgi:hypothetical protein
MYRRSRPYTLDVAVFYHGSPSHSHVTLVGPAAERMPYNACILYLLLFAHQLYQTGTAILAQQLLVQISGVSAPECQNAAPYVDLFATYIELFAT